MATTLLLTIVTFVGVLFCVSAHSFLTYPEPLTHKPCRVGGPIEFRNYCPGPCNLINLEENPPRAHYYPEKIGNKQYAGGGKPGATLSRGQKVQIKYSRNNHSPGGFNRFTLVRPEDTMNRVAHDKNVFWYSCWGAEFRVAVEAERDRDSLGFNVMGSDRKRPNGPAQGYYTTDVVIPQCVPDGKYILGFTWYGGTGGARIGTNNPDKPGQFSGFGDYWSCSFIEIKGGPMADSCDVIFKADSKYSKDKCFASVDRPGAPECNATPENPQSFSEVCQCKVEPCLKNGQKVLGSYMVPASFNGTKPAPLTPANWGGKVTTSTPAMNMTYEELQMKYDELRKKMVDGAYIKKSSKCSAAQFNDCTKKCGL